MSSNNQYKTGPFNRGDKLTARHLETIRDAGRGNAQIRNPDNFVTRLPSGHKLTSKRRAKPGGSERPYIVITTVTDKDNYVGDVITPTDVTVLIEDVTIQTPFSSEGLLKVGDEMFCDKVGDVYYISPATFLGA